MSVKVCTPHLRELHFFLSLMHGITRIYIQGNIIIGGTKWGCLEATADWRALPKKAVYWKIFHWL